MIKGAIFDMDGTVLDSMHLWIHIGPRFLEHIGVKTDLDIKNETKTMLFEEMNNYFNEHGLIDMTLEEFTKIANSMVEQGYYYEVEAKPGVREFLTELKARGIPMVLATATDLHLVEAALKRLDLFDFFDAIYTCNSLGVDKKVTTIYDVACAHLGTEKSETYIFEDTLTPITTLAPTDYKVVGVFDKWSHKRTEDIKALADIYVENLLDLDIDKL